MQHFRNILVGVDLSRGDRISSTELSPPTLAAIERAIWLGQMSRAEVTFFAALDVSPQTEDLLAEEFDSTAHDVRDATEEVLAELAGRAREAGVVAHSAFAFGKSWREIIHRASGSQHDLVIVGTRDFSALSQLLLGSTAQKLLRNCPCPVWVTKPVTEPEIANILVASDLSDVSQRALQLGLGAGQLLHARVHVLHAVDFEAAEHTRSKKRSKKDVAARRQEERATAERQLHEQLSRTDYRTLSQGVMIHIVEGSADEAILLAIEEHEIDLLVMGISRGGGVAELLLGHTAERLLPQLTCSILAVKPADFVSPVSAD